MNTNQNNFSLSYGVLSISLNKERENENIVNVDNYSMATFQTESFLENLEAPVEKCVIDPEKSTVTYMKNGNRETIRVNSETFKKSIQERKERLESRDTDR